jgi:hypothetical protein
MHGLPGGARIGGAQQPSVHTGLRQTVVDVEHSSGSEHGVPPMPQALEPPPGPPLELVALVAPVPLLELPATAPPPVEPGKPPVPLLEPTVLAPLPVEPAPVPP